MKIQVYYCFEPISFDCTDIHEVNQVCELLQDYSQLSDQLALLKKSFEENLKTRADIILAIMPEISGVIQVSVFNNLKVSLFSKKIKKHCISVSLRKYHDENSLGVYSKDFDNYEEVQSLLDNLINHYETPDLSSFKCSIKN